MVYNNKIIRGFLPDFLKSNTRVVGQISKRNEFKTKKKAKLSLFVIERCTVFAQLGESLKKSAWLEWLSQFLKVSRLIALFLIIVGKREKLLINLPSFIDIGMQVNFRSLDRGVAKIFLYNPEIFWSFIKFACIAVPYFMRCYPRGCVMLEDMLYRSWWDIFTLLT